MRLPCRAFSFLLTASREIKFGALLEKLPQQSGTYQNAWFATGEFLSDTSIASGLMPPFAGHYASKAWSNDSRPKLVRPTDHRKDQTYFLSAITEAGLRRALFPIGHLRKLQVREIAKQHMLPTAERRDSVGICFVGKKTHFNGFLGALHIGTYSFSSHSCVVLASYLPAKPGPIINKLTGKIVAEHTGLWNFTVGQNARVQSLPEKMFVAEKDIKNNTIYLVPGR